MGIMEKWGEMGGNGGEWGKTEENGGKWRKMGGNGGKWGSVRKCQKYLVGNVEKICEGDNMGQISCLATFPAGAFDEFCSPNWLTGKMEDF